MRIMDWSSDVSLPISDRFVLAGDSKAEVFEPHFTYHGFRYVEIEGYPGAPTADDIEGIVVYSACRTTGEMRFASPLVQKIWQNAEWSQRSNRSEEHTSELQSLMSNSYAVVYLKKNNKSTKHTNKR